MTRYGNCEELVATNIKHYYCKECGLHFSSVDVKEHMEYHKFVYKLVQQLGDYVTEAFTNQDKFNRVVNKQLAECRNDLDADKAILDYIVSYYAIVLKRGRKIYFGTYAGMFMKSMYNELSRYSVYTNNMYLRLAIERAKEKYGFDDGLLPNGLATYFTDEWALRGSGQPYRKGYYVSKS